MAHTTVQMISLSKAGNLVNQPFSIECWRATLIFTSAGGGSSITIDGIPWDVLLGTGGAKQTQRIELGGAYHEGRPVNIKHDLRITTNGETLYALLILQHFVDDGK